MISNPFTLMSPWRRLISNNTLLINLQHQYKGGGENIKQQNQRHLWFVNWSHDTEVWYLFHFLLLWAQANTAHCTAMTSISFWGNAKQKYSRLLMRKQPSVLGHPIFYQLCCLSTWPNLPGCLGNNIAECFKMNAHDIASMDGWNHFDNYKINSNFK